MRLSSCAGSKVITDPGELGPDLLELLVERLGRCLVGHRGLDGSSARRASLEPPGAVLDAGVAGRPEQGFRYGASRREVTVARARRNHATCGRIVTNSAHLGPVHSGQFEGQSLVPVAVRGSAAGTRGGARAG